MSKNNTAKRHNQFVDLSFEERYNAVGKTDPQFEGIFITAVKSTGIFCRPSCRARKPLAKNVTFYKTPSEALKHGYRPCKVCRPMENQNETPDFIQNLIEELHHTPFKRIKDWDLRAKGLEPSRIRRWFKKHHGITFQTYQRLIRINTSYQQIQRGQAVTDTAFASGYESLSGFNERYKAIFGNPPSQSSSTPIIYISRFTTPLGPMFAATSPSGLCLLEFTERRMLEAEFKDLRKRLKAVIIPGTNEWIEQAKQEVCAYFNGQLHTFSVPLHTPGTDFQQKVWHHLQAIPYGKTCSYQQLAQRIGKPSAVRAVARAVGMNRIALAIPCHRVIGSNGNLTGYAGGLPRKKWLLEMEASHP